MINANLKDLTYLKKIFLLDYTFLSDNKFFSKYPNELELFSDIKKDFFGKIGFYFNLSYVLFFAMNIANIFLAIFILKALNADESAIDVSFGILISIVIFCGIFIMEKKT